MDSSLLKSSFVGKSSSGFSSSFSSDDKDSVVIEIGQAWTKVGLSGEPSPRHITKTNQFLSTEDYEIRLSGSTGDHGYRHQQHNREAWLILIENLLHHIYFTLLEISPMDHRCVIVEDIYSSREFKEALAFTLLVKMKVPGIMFLVGQAAAPFAEDCMDALLIDCGWSSTTALPVLEGIPLYADSVVSPIGMETTLNSLKELLSENNENLNYNDNNLLEHVLIKTCFVSNIEKNLTASPVVLSANHEHPKIVVNAETRAFATERLFKTHEYGDSISIANVLLDCLLNLDIIERARVAHNIIVCGGTANLPGFQYRLEQEVDRLISTKKYEKIANMRNRISYKKPFYPLNLLGWIGSSILTSSKNMLLQDFISLEEFKNTNSVPDWQNVSNKVIRKKQVRTKDSALYRAAASLGSLSPRKGQ